MKSTVNGTSTEIDGDVHTSALDFLRSRGLTGCKEGCAEGECGACAVLVARPDGPRTRWTAINACLVPAPALAGQEVLTAEGLGSPTDLHPVQREMAERGGSQCGYCTPGFVCSMAAEYYRPDRRIARDGGDEHESEPPESGLTHAEQGPPVEEGENGFDLHALSGNLCRCTGYRPIRDAAFALGFPESGDTIAERRNTPAPQPEAVDVSDGTARYRRPESLAEALQVLREDPETQVVAGCTDWGVEVGVGGKRASSMLAIDRLPELRRIDWSDERIELGSALTLSELERATTGRLPLLAELIPQFASRLIRNSATIGGNIGTGSPIGDAPPVLLALEASLVLASADGEREIPLAEYFTGYRQTVRRDDELITAVRIPLPLAPLTRFHKVAKRRFDDISSVAVAYALSVEDGVVARARIGLGGVAATPLRARETERALEGQPWSAETARAVSATLVAEGTPMDDHRASARYRSAMLGTSLERFFAETDETARDGRALPPGFRPTGRKAVSR